ncbi:hypothetical protein SKAU_G00308390 [Synaphobranchus kaupii]|uniref:Uncharacterized protein n=1 Tax=Synaphobranchus kaupii TaxID=118154 RepID=A0A9Q1IL46_SYNKA|nr:hypothetical protein SKAU_G00308390 [Synaphobranchus kaupii]
MQAWKPEGKTASLPCVGLRFKAQWTSKSNSVDYKYQFRAWAGTLNKMVCSRTSQIMILWIFVLSIKAWISCDPHSQQPKDQHQASSDHFDTVTNASLDTVRDLAHCSICWSAYQPLQGRPVSLKKSQKYTLSCDPSTRWRQNNFQWKPARLVPCEDLPVERSTLRRLRKA